MAKRPNPYIDDIIPQSKVHIGIKQFNNNEDRLKKVYEKTIKLLFKGARKLPVQNGIITSDSDRISDIKKDNMKQLLIGKNCTLLKSNDMVSDKSSSIQHCACGSSVIESLCGYCEKSLCVSCIHLCINCNQCYCSSCSCVVSEGNELCLSCMQ